MIKPRKPKYYWLKRLVTTIAYVLLGFSVSIFFDLRGDNSLNVSWGLFFLCVVPAILWGVLSFRVFLKYENEILKYDSHITNEAEKVREAKYWDRINKDKELAKTSMVNENITNYLEEQRKRKENAKWWQIWV